MFKNYTTNIKLTLRWVSKVKNELWTSDFILLWCFTNRTIMWVDFLRGGHISTQRRVQGADVKGPDCIFVSPQGGAGKLEKKRSSQWPGSEVGFEQSTLQTVALISRQTDDLYGVLTAVISSHAYSLFMCKYSPVAYYRIHQLWKGS